MRSIACAAVLAATTIFAATAVSAQPYQMSLAGASPQGLWSLIGVGMDRVVKAAHPGSTITYQTTGGGFANIQLLNNKTAQLGIAHDAELGAAVAGTEPFKAKITDMRMIGYLYNWSPMQPILSKEFADKHGIKSFEDIGTKAIPIRITVNRRGNIASSVAENMLKQIGLDEAKLKANGGALVYAASEEQSDLMRDRRVDMSLNSLFVGVRSLIEMGQALPVVMLPTSDKTIDAVAKAMGTQKYVIKGGSYPWQPNDVPSITLGAGIVTNTAMAEKDAYNIAKALVQHIGEMQGVHNAMKALTPALLVSQNVVPYHPGAVRAYKELGLMK